ncbi:aminotransferase class V-fold PLP-dependent enzyme [Candidatus Micrarchaeota archaeon]|nr:aminotransferase class V-fold PLP-dependent enzyme [Candidatus Micrarchaeota archaeon]
MKLTTVHPHVKSRLSSQAHRFHEIREETVLPMFLNQAQGTRAPDAQHLTTHQYFNQLAKDRDFELAQFEILPSEAASLVRGFTGAHHVAFGSSVSALFAQCVLTLRPAWLLATNHEYPGLVEFVRSGVLYDSLCTSQMYGLQTHYSSPKSSIKPILSTLFDPSDLWDLLKKASELSGPGIILVSHVSRVDGRIMPIGEIETAINVINGHRRDKITLMVDGSQAIGTMEIDLTYFSGIYLFTSSKALAAEVGMGVAVGNAAVAETLNSILSWFSLPELHSLVDVLQNTDYSKKYGELRIMQRSVASRAARISSLHLPCVNQSSPYMLYFEIPGVDPLKIASEAALRGFEIYGESSRYVYIEPKYARVSYLPETNWEHVDAFFAFLEGLVQRLK